MTNDLQPYLTVRVEPNDMVQYVHNLMTAARMLARSVNGAAIRRAHAPRNCAGARSIVRLAMPASARGPHSQKRNQIHVPAALIGAAGVASLTVAEDEVVFDIPTLLDATLQLCEPVGHA